MERAGVAGIHRQAQRWDLKAVAIGNDESR
jgi:hypothetical protein